MFIFNLISVLIYKKRSNLNLFSNQLSVVNSQVFPVDVNDESTMVGGSVVFKCSVPSSENSYSRVEQWSVNDALTINRDSLIGKFR